ncbi:MAG: NADPH-adrenodoxin reductase [Peltula sp. TS41687]|nr:MAG: NADPH-adrenodoxin reductase [Peltula sp. TS41687]
MLLGSPRNFICRRCATALTRPQRKRYSSSINHAVQRARPLRLAVIGSGPAGFYAAYKLLSKLEDAIVDMYEKLPVPFGLVRFGVAPDHPEVKGKNCQDKFTEVAESGRFNFVGNIAVGSDLPLQAIKPHYDAILFAYGASKDRWLNIPGESTLKGIYSARAFVGWYNGLPEYAGLNPDLTVGKEAVIIGQGNVALDVARILLSEVDALRKTDITDYALDALSRSRIESVRIVGRRGPMQAAFTVKEVRELMKLPRVGFVPIDPFLLPPDPSKDWTLPRIQKRLAAVLAKGSTTPPALSSKRWELSFFLAPTAFRSSPNNPDQLSHLTLEKTLPKGRDPFLPSVRVQGTGETTDLPASVAFRSIGYKSEPLPGLVESGIPFDEKLGIIPNDVHGRVLAPATESTAVHVPGFYVAGWSKRGPTGVIASTMEDAFATAEIIAKDWADNVRFLNHEEDGGGGTGLGWEGVKAEAERRGLRRVSWTDWKRIDAVEKHKGKLIEKERDKFPTVEEMLKILDRSPHIETTT